MLQRTVSVIVPVYNAAAYLNKCVESIVNQSFSDMEIILVDDGATDESPAICEAYARRDQRVKVVHKENGGLMSAWMAGVTTSTGEYLCFVDSDDWIDDCMIEEMIKSASRESKEVICCNFMIEKDTVRSPQQHKLAPGIYEGTELIEVKHQLLGNEEREISFSRCMKLISRDLIEQNMHFCDQRIKMGEDVNIILPALLDAERLVILEKAYYYHYYYNQSSMVHKYDKGLYDNIKVLRQVIIKILEGKYKDADSDERKEMLQRADMEYIFLLLLAVKNEARGNQEGYRHNIKILCGEERELIQNTPVKVETKANRLLYLTLKHPNFFSLTLLRMAMLIYYR